MPVCRDDESSVFLYARDVLILSLATHMLFFMTGVNYIMIKPQKIHVLKRASNKIVLATVWSTYAMLQRLAGICLDFN